MAQAAFGMTERVRTEGDGPFLANGAVCRSGG
jgi:hypothetical protein